MKETVSVADVGAVAVSAVFAVFAMSLAIDFAFVSTPGGLGGYAASMYCARRAGISMSAATSSRKKNC